MFRNRRRVPLKRMLFRPSFCMYLVVSALASGAMNCGSGDDDGADGLGGGDDGASLDGEDLDSQAANDASLGFDVASPPAYDVTVVDQGLGCFDAPPQPSLIFESCCNGLACGGFCIRADDGGAACDCYGVRGGCWDGSVCCNYRQGCATPEACEHSK